jgi:hypothetical protein
MDIKADLETLGDKEAAKERFWQDFGDKGFKVSDKMLEQLYGAGYEAGKADGIPQGVLDGYDAGYAAARKKVVADLAQLPSDPPKLYLALLEFIDKLKRDTPEDSDE